MQIVATRRSGADCIRVLLLASASMALLMGCGMPRSMDVRKGGDPQYEDDDVRFRTTYYFRVFDLCEGRTQMDRPRDEMKVLFDSAQRGPYYLKTDSLYRFVMTGKSSSFSNIHFEAGSLRKEQIDPFGTTINYSKDANAFVLQSQEQARAKTERAETIAHIRELVKLREELSKLEGSGTAVDAIVKQHLNALAPTGKADAPGNAAPLVNAPAVQTAMAASVSGQTADIEATLEEMRKSAKVLATALTTADTALGDELRRMAQQIGQSPTALTEPGQATTNALQILTGRVKPFFDKVGQTASQLEAQRSQNEAAYTAAVAAEQQLARDASDDERARLRTDRETAAKALQDATAKATVAKARQGRLGPAATAAAAAIAALQPLAVAAGNPFSPAFRSSLLQAVNATATDKTNDAAALLNLLGQARDKDHALPPVALETARGKIIEAGKGLDQATGDAEELQAGRDLEAAMTQIVAAQKDRAPYVDSIGRLTGTALALAALRASGKKLAAVDVDMKLTALQTKNPKASTTTLASQAQAYADSLAIRIALHNDSLAKAAAPATLAPAAASENDAARNFRAAAITAQTATAAAHGDAVALRTALQPSLAEIAGLSSLAGSGGPVFDTALAQLRADNARLGILAELAAENLKTLDERTAQLVREAGRQPAVTVKATGETPAGNVRCDNGMTARRGFQILGPEGFRTFDQDERLLMAMTSNAKPLIGMLTDLSNRAINARKGSVDGGRAIADERRRVGRARDVLDTFTMLGKDADYKPSELAKRVGDAFAETSDRKAR